MWLDNLPEWAADTLLILIPSLEVVLIIAAGWAVNAAAKYLFRRVAKHYMVAQRLLRPMRNVVRWLIMLVVLILILERAGVRGSLMWTVLSGVIAVMAVAFVAAWSVLSNIFCAVLILLSRPFRMHDRIEVLDRLDQGGVKGEVIDINLLFTTLRETAADGESRLLQIPNSLLLLRVVRRWVRSD